MPFSKKINAAFVRQGGGVEVRKVERPVLDEGALIVQMKASGICGTDLEKLTGRNITSSILGHEVAGIVSESATSLFEKGDLVVPHHHVACGECHLCRADARTMCEGFRTSNFAPCGFADEFKVPAYNVIHGGVHLLRKGITFEEASFAEPLGCCIRALDRALSENAIANSFRHVLVVGAGPIGLLHMELISSRFPECKIVATDVNQTRLNFASKFEKTISVNSKIEKERLHEALLAEAGPEGYDLVIIATGNEEAFTTGLKCVRKSGSVLLFGAPHKGSIHQLDMAKFFLNELTLTSSYATTEVEIDAALDLIENRRIDVKKFITGVYPLERIDEAMNAARSENHVKVLVVGA